MTLFKKKHIDEMGTYNYSGMYYKGGLASFSKFNHFLWDMLPYYRLGNVSKDDLQKSDGKTGDNKTRYSNNNDAKQAREAFEEKWKGIKE